MKVEIYKVKSDGEFNGVQYGSEELSTGDFRLVQEGDYRALESQLREANEVIAKYANKENWTGGNTCYADVFKFGDCEPEFEIEDYAGVCGKRAREYLAKYAPTK